MLAGKPPVGGDSDMATAVARLTNAPQPVSAARPEVPRSLEDVVARSLARDPEYRYQSAQAFKEALAAGGDAADTGPLTAPIPTPPPPRRSAAPSVSPGRGGSSGEAPTSVGPRPAPPRPAPPPPAPPAPPAPG